MSVQPTDLGRTGYPFRELGLIDTKEAAEPQEIEFESYDSLSGTGDPELMKRKAIKMIEEYHREYSKYCNLGTLGQGYLDDKYNLICSFIIDCDIDLESPQRLIVHDERKTN